MSALVLSISCQTSEPFVKSAFDDISIQPGDALYRT